MVATAGEKERLISGRDGPLRVVIARYRTSGLELLHISLESGEAALPVFSSPESAGEFLASFAPGPGWYARECSAGELISLLARPGAAVKRILPCPPSQPAVSPDGSVGPLETLHRKDFIATLARDRA